MRYSVFPIYSNKSYGITIGSRVKPDSEFREQVVSQIDKAMSSFERSENQTHKVAIVPDSEPLEGGSPELPRLETRAQYLIFALFYSKEGDSGEALDNHNLELYRAEIESMLSGIVGETRAALVLLRDCSVSLIETDNSGPWLYWDSPNIVSTGPEDWDTPLKRWG